MVVARPEALGARRARGTGRRARRARRARRRRSAAARRRPRDARCARVAVAPIRVYQRADLAGAPAPLQVRADVLGLRRAGDPGVRHTARLGARGVAPAALQSVQPRRLRPGRRPAPLPRGPTRRARLTPLFAVFLANIFQPLIDFFE